MKYASFLTVIFLSGCVSFGVREKGNGEMVNESYEVSSFSNIQIGGAYEIFLIPSSDERVEVEIDDNLLEFLVVEVNGNTLDIHNSDRIYSERGIDITIYYNTIEDIRISGACEFSNEEPLVGEDLLIDMSGAGAVNLQLDVEDLRLDISGAGAVNLEGKTNSQKIRMSGAGGYKGFDLVSNSADIVISGIGGADILVLEKLDAEISGLGGISYRGGAEDVQTNVSGLGTIQKAD